MIRVSQFLLDNPLLLLFVVVAIGYPLGCLKIRLGRLPAPQDPDGAAGRVGCRRPDTTGGLRFALEQSGDGRPNVGYAAICPLAMIVKIALAQVLVVLLL
jgi:putative transport protein